MRRFRVWDIFGILALALVLAQSVTPADAALRRAIENVVESWFGSGGQLNKMEFFPSTVTPKPDRCTVWVDKTTLNMMVGCDENTATVLASASALGCTQSASGVLTCNSFISTDQNSLSPVAANRWRVFDNDVDLTPNPSCADYGQAGTLTLLDVDESATDVYVICNGTTEAMSVGSTLASCGVADANHLGYNATTRAWICD